jgi:hypothetical protein
MYQQSELCFTCAYQSTFQLFQAMVRALKATGATPDEIAKTMLQVRQRGDAFCSNAFSKTESDKTLSNKVSTASWTLGNP